MTNDSRAEISAADFFDWLLSLGPEGRGVAMTAIPLAGGRTTTKTFFDGREVVGWLAGFEGRQNCYYMPNPPRGEINTKAAKEGVSHLAVLHVDLDPRDGYDRETERQRILASLEAFYIPPTAVIDSGNGFQALWSLEHPTPIADRDHAEELERYNRQLEDLLQGDHCFNCDRLLRAPDTTNLPNAKKLAAGRAPQPARVVSLRPERVYPLDRFDMAEPIHSNAANTGTKAAAVSLPDSIPPADLDKLPTEVSQRTRMLIVQGDDPDDPTRYKSKSEVMWAVLCELVRANCDVQLIASVLLDRDLGISDHPLRQKRPVDYVTRQIERARDDNDTGGRRVLDPAAPFRTAERLRDELFPTAIHTNDDWLEHDRGAYRDVEDGTIRKAIYDALDQALVRKTDTKGVVRLDPFNPNPANVNSVLDALTSHSHVPANRIAPPAWLEAEGLPPAEIVACRNGLLHVPSAELLPPTPSFFTRNALDIDYKLDAEEPREWKRFVAETFPDPVARELLQDWFGYLLLPDTSMEKMLLMVGPPRSGKGTIQKVITKLVGPSNTCSPSIKSLANGFGLQPMIGKQVAFLSDIRVGRMTDGASITETLLRISGQDDVTADRKFKEAWTGRLAVRFVVSSNELPKLNDNSPALANRFTPLIFEKSHLGREDPGLADRLIAKLPGILNWSLDGRRRLHERGRFVLPRASQSAVAEILALGSPVAAFVAERCVVGPDLIVPKAELFAAWRRYCLDNDLRPGGENVFARDLIAATSVEQYRPRAGGSRTYAFRGIALLPGVSPQGDDSGEPY